MIESGNLSFTYQGSKGKSLNDVSLTIEKGECVVLCGKSGSGKTTFSRFLNGLAPSFYPGKMEGTCRVCDLISGSAAIEDYVRISGSVFQNPKTQYFNVDTTSELAFPCENTGMSSAKISERMEEVVSQFHLENLIDRNVFELSGGEKQRLAFAVACMLKPELLVLDEATSNLDADAITQLHDMIAIMKQQGVTVVMAEHRLAWIQDLADWYLYFDHGRLMEQWTQKEFAQLTEEKLSELGLRTKDLSPYREKLKEMERWNCSGIPVLTIQDLTIGYDRKHPVLHLPDMSFMACETVCIMGSNGTGKSTFARTICGLLKPISGEIRWYDEKADPVQCLHMSYEIMQDVNYQLFSDSVREEVLLGNDSEAECDEILKELGLYEFSDRHPMSLSGGEKQRVVIASALMSRKQLIILDEPTSGLDKKNMQKVGRLLNQLKEKGKTVLVITHDEELASAWCDRIIRFERNER